MRLIDADALINNLEMLIEEQEEDDHVETWNNAITCAINEVKHHAPTVDAVKHGRWEYIGGYGYKYRCSECIRCAERTSKYCPNCGARMDAIT